MNLLQAANIVKGTEKAATVADLETARRIVHDTPRIQHDGWNWFVLSVGKSYDGKTTHCHLAACFARQHTGAFVQIADWVPNATLARAGIKVEAAH